ncbi:MAG: hypothetical protein ACRDDF_05450, partial [Aeromonas sp.]
NTTLTEFLVSLNIVVIHGRPRNPKAQGQVERVNQTIKRWLAKKIYDTGSYQWSLYHEDVVYSYNITIHSATGKSPYMLFHYQLRFNCIEPVLIMTDTLLGIEAGELETSDDLTRGGWDFDSEPVSISMNETTNPHDVSNVEDIRQVDQEVATHFEKYKKRMIDNANSNLISCKIKVGDKILVKKDFDNNVKTKKLPFESFYEKDSYVVIELLANNMVVIETLDRKQRKTVCRGVIKTL